MCSFFSFCMDEYGKKYYFDWAQRQEMKFEGADSHDHIISAYKLKDAKINCFEYNPLLKTFRVDKINVIDNRVQAEEWVKKLDFKKIVEPLIIKEIINPLTGKSKKPTKGDVALLKKWASVGDSVGASVGASVWASVGDSVWDSVWDSVGDSVGYSVGYSVWDSVRDSVRASVWDSVWDSVRDSARAYTGSFFDIQYKHDFSPAIKLWERGFVPSYDGKTWRLHSGAKAEIVYEEA